MDYRPRYPQPFTLQEAIALDVPVITEEIARLQNSLQHLRRTQNELQAASDAAPDPEFTKAIEENDLVIGSQEERISILKMALTEKGILMGSHYDLNPTQQPTGRGDASHSAAQQVETTSISSTQPAATSNHQPVEEAEDGVFL
ncbi:uncharacterized protein C8Q71DRAFT_852765 [Rhodofomes roseus]|uniref:Uncharacterized protein n=1 Tax=Rhodofomes roseus TaxID=34475 RepID=A0A4Y9Y448_9APHY|nr:uncharacterized protein C8Q71DRAFT_852765 [Rhodofomes roseus]KAH9844263.1 hypothetical protein C8Q71DRAFT_852765 [Rhodofomes roseus]TFY56357.1 hypothetical protein EVJ58_g7694 [Rhodofomes roseus]